LVNSLSYTCTQVLASQLSPLPMYGADTPLIFAQYI
jgi:hypothetical protein